MSVLKMICGRRLRQVSQGVVLKFRSYAVLTPQSSQPRDRNARTRRQIYRKVVSPFFQPRPRGLTPGPPAKERIFRPARLGAQNRCDTCGRSDGKSCSTRVWIPRATRRRRTLMGSDATSSLTARRSLSFRSSRRARQARCRCSNLMTVHTCPSRLQSAGIWRGLTQPLRARPT